MLTGGWKMRRVLLITGVLIGVIIALFAYALINLSAIIASNRGYILARGSDAIGRPVEVAEIKAHLGWGASMDLREVKIADDPAFARTPFLQAHDVYVELSLLPLLARSLKVSRILIAQPAVRLIRNRAGRFNMSTIGGPRAIISTPPAAATGGILPGGSSGVPSRSEPQSAAGHGVGLAALTVRSLTIENGALYYEDEEAGGPPINLKQFDLTVSDFRADRAFRLKVALAALSDQPNLHVAGEVGPLMRESALAPDLAPFDLTAEIGPLSLAQLRSLPQLGRLLPAQLAVSEPATIEAKIRGPVGTLHVEAQSDLSSSHIVYGGVIDKAAGVPFQLTVNGARNSNRIMLSKVGLAGAGLNLTAADITYGEGKIGARLDASQSDLAQLGKVLTLARAYQLGGEVSLHANLALTGRKAAATGSLVLSRVEAAPPGSKAPLLTDLSGTIRLAGETAKVGPLSGNIGSSRATVVGDVGSFEPLRASYQVAVDTLKVGEFVPSRQELGEQMVQVAARGNLSRDASVMTASTKLTSVSGTLANVAYQTLALSGAYADGHLTIDSLNLGAFDGALSAAGSAVLGRAPSFDLKLNAENMDLQKALESQMAKAAETIRGRLTGNLEVTGAGAQFEQIRPTLRGAGRATMSQGGLVGVNVVAQALNKVDRLPGIGALVPAEVVNHHPELFKSSDTAIDEASLSFTLQGARLTSHDINARTSDYTILGDGWFDMDKQLDVAARILLSPAFSLELVNARRNVAYLETPQRQVEIPLRIAGQLPRPSVVPDATILVQRATSKALESGLGRLLGGSSSGRAGEPVKAKSPLEQLKGLFH